MPEPYAFDPDNVEFFAHVCALKGLGATQAQLARILGISAPHITRLKRGERHATRKHVGVLNQYLNDLLDIRTQRAQSLLEENNMPKGTIPMNAVGEFVIVIPDKSGESQQGGIILPDSGEKHCGTVVSISAEAADKIPDLAVGKRVIYGRHWAHEFRYAGVDYEATKYAAIFAVI